MTVGRGNVLSGARVRLLLEATKIMYCTNCRYSEMIEHAPIEVLDQFDVAEHVPLAYRVEFSAQFVRVLKNPIKRRDGVAIMPTLENILTAPTLTGSVEDRTGVIVANIEQVRCSRYTVNHDARGIVLTDCEFVAIRIRDESEIA